MMSLEGRMSIITGHQSQRRASSALISTIFLVGLSLAACNQGISQPQPQQEAPKSDPAEKIRKLEWDTFVLEGRVSDLESGSAAISTEDEGYSIAKTNFGGFTVSARAVTPYLDGFKVKLRFGNLSSADFEGATISVCWGSVGGLKIRYCKSSKIARYKEFTVTNRFPAGTFTDVELAITPAKPEEVKNLSVGLQLDRIVLRVR